MKKGKFLIRADASRQIGSGHVMRMIALGQGLLAKGQEVHFATIPHSAAIVERLEKENFSLHLMEETQSLEADCKALIEIAASLEPKFILLDGYNFDAPYQGRIKTAGFKLFYMDDLGQGGIVADIVLNQNVCAKDCAYEPPGAASFYLGTEYALLRREFIESTEGFERLFPETAKNILITLGGCDPDNITLKILEQLHRADIQGLHINAILGGLNKHKASIAAYLKNAKLNLEILENVNEAMPELIKWADIGICAAGSSILEMSLLELPSMAVCLADNQSPNWNALKVANAILGFELDDLGNNSFSKAFSNFAKDKEDRQNKSKQLESLKVGKLFFQLESHLIHGTMQTRLSKIFAKKYSDRLLGLINKSKYVDWKEANLLMDLPQKWALSQSLLKDEEIAGVCISSLKGDEAYVHFLSIAEQFQRRGLGKNLLKTLDLDAVKMGVKKISLRCPTENERALNFYRKNGFETIAVVDDEISRPYRDNIMLKKL